MDRVYEQVIHTVRGEGGAADDLDTITDDGDALEDDEIVVLKIGTTDEPITVKHLANTLELDGDVDWTMTSLDDELTLQYDLTGTKWEETGRINATS